MGRILLDVNMPVMNGFEVLKKLRAHPSTVATPVILITSLSPEAGEAVAAAINLDRLGAWFEERPLAMTQTKHDPTITIVPPICAAKGERHPL